MDHKPADEELGVSHLSPYSCPFLSSLSPFKFQRKKRKQVTQRSSLQDLFLAPPLPPPDTVPLSLPVLLRVIMYSMGSGIQLP